MANFCSECGAALNPRAAFCPMCGAPAAHGGDKNPASSGNAVPPAGTAPSREPAACPPPPFAVPVSMPGYAAPPINGQHGGCCAPAPAVSGNAAAPPVSPAAEPQGQGAPGRSAPAPSQGQPVSRNIFLCPDGKYRWVYEMNLLKNPTVFLLVWKIFFFIVLGIFAFVAIIDAGDQSDFWWDGFLELAKIFGYILAGMTALVGVSCLLYAAMMGGKYCVIFEMDEHGVNHKQLPSQAKKARVIAGLTVLAGAASGNLSTVGAGLGAARTEMYSEFAKVRKVKAYPRRHVIKVNERLNHNQVYAAKEDFAFVESFIRAHCPQKQ